MKSKGSRLVDRRNKMIDADSKRGDYDMKIKIFQKSSRRVER